MQFFSSNELTSIVNDYDRRNGTTIDTELELMSALAAVDIRCSGGISGLQDFIMTELARSERVSDGPQSSPSMQNNNNYTNNKSVYSRSITAAGTTFSPMEGGGFMIGLNSGRRGSASLTAAGPVGAAGAVSPSMKAAPTSKLAKRQPHKTASPSSVNMSQRTISPKKTQDASTSKNKCRSSTTSAMSPQGQQHDVHPLLVDTKSPFTTDNKNEISILSPSPVNGSLFFGRDCALQPSAADQNRSALPPSWAALELPMTTADFAQLVLALKGFLYRQMVEDARGIGSVSRGTGVAVRDAAVMALAEHQLQPSSGGVLHALMNAADESADARLLGGGLGGAAGAAVPRSHHNRRRSSLGRTTNTAASGNVDPINNLKGNIAAAAEDILVHSCLTQVASLPVKLLKRRLDNMEIELDHYKDDLLEALLCGDEPISSAFSDQTGNESPSSLNRFGSSASAASFAASPDSTLRSSLGGHHHHHHHHPSLTETIKNVCRGFNLDPSVILSEYKSFQDQQQLQLAQQRQNVDGEGSDGGSSASLFPSVSTQALTPLDYSFGGRQHNTGHSGDENPDNYAFTTWLLGRQERIVREVHHRIEGGGTGTNTAAAPGKQNQTMTPLTAAGGGAAAAAAANEDASSSTAPMHRRRWLANTPGQLSIHASASHNADSVASNHRHHLDETSLHPISDFDAKAMEGRTPRRADTSAWSGMAPVDLTVERCSHRVRAMRHVVPFELGFPYSPAVAAKDTKKVTSVDEMLDDICASLPSSRVREVGLALRARRAHRLNPRALGFTGSCGGHKRSQQETTPERDAAVLRPATAEPHGASHRVSHLLHHRHNGDTLADETHHHQSRPCEGDDSDDELHDQRRQTRPRTATLRRGSSSARLRLASSIAAAAADENASTPIPMITSSEFNHEESPSPIHGSPHNTETMAQPDDGVEHEHDGIQMHAADSVDATVVAVASPLPAVLTTTTTIDTLDSTSSSCAPATAATAEASVLIETSASMTTTADVEARAQYDFWLQGGQPIPKPLPARLRVQATKNARHQTTQKPPARIRV